jgi:glycosyltransferase involved in cell wall biosynthesis
MSSNAAASGRVIHLVPPNGGGVDRFVRDLVVHRPADWIVHACEAQAVVEVPARPTFVPLDAGAFAHLAYAGRLGRPLAVHAHSTTPVVRALADRLGAALDVPCVLTLHDIGFDDAALPPAEHEARLRFARAATLRTAPSRYLVDRAVAALGADAVCRWVENGADPFTAPEPQVFAAPMPAGPFLVAVIGALGEHKGLLALLETAGHLPADVRVVILGYTAQQLMPGWAVPGRVWMHGAFQPGELPALVRHYGARLAFFPPGMPESYCYALSDAWLAGLPALVPDHGALGERVRRHGGGALYPPALAADALARCLAEHAAAAQPGAAQRAAAALSTVGTMVNAMNAIYDDAAGGAAQRPADEVLLSALAQQHLDTRFFRKELLRLQRELEAATHERDHLRALHQHEQRAAQRVEALERELAMRWAQREHDVAALTRERDDALAAYAALVARVRRPLRVLPAPLRERVIRLAKRLLP